MAQNMIENHIAGPLCSPFIMYFLPGSPFREQRSISDFCDRHASLYERYCAGRLSDFDASSRSKLERFCAEFEDSCSTPNEYQVMPIPKINWLPSLLWKLSNKLL